MSINQPISVKFKVSSFRKIPNPFYNTAEPDQDMVNILNKPEMYMLICDVQDLPGNIPMGTNPREQNTNKHVPQIIEKSLVNPENRNFYLLNRGLLLSAGAVAYDANNGYVTIIFDDLSVHGDVDGGHTYKVILENREQLERGRQYVKIEVLTGIEDMFEQLAAARNTSVQVKDTSIAELEKRFELIKDAFKYQPFVDRIAYRENDNLNKKDIDVSDILAIFNLFNIDKYPGPGSYPTNSYNGKNSCIQEYIKQDKERENDAHRNPYVKMKPIMADIIKLYDELEMKMPDFYQSDAKVARFGSITGVTNRKTGASPFTTKFYKNPIEHLIPTGFIYPILGSFRALVVDINGQYSWKMDPFKTLKVVGPTLVNTTIQFSRDFGNNPNKTGKTENVWRTLYMCVNMEAMMAMEKKNG
jgi:AIPR protein.